ncbi:NADH dehydrogenase [ubiquinone] 1 alpha subcomplex subunit 10, mitochondrial, partial [Tachysurus ichikawai]
MSVIRFTGQAGIHTCPVRRLRYGWWAYALGERTTPRLKENSKIFCVDGNLASGKGVLAQKLAERLGMLYMPEPDVNYVDRMTKEKIPLDSSYNGNCSLEKFYLDPKASDGNSYRLQSWMYLMRLLQYSDAVEHLLTTGQGVILERSPFSDVVFLEAMFNQGYMRKQCVDHYNEIKDISICEFWVPHLVIYVDSPAEEVQKKLKASGKVCRITFKPGSGSLTCKEGEERGGEAERGRGERESGREGKGRERERPRGEGERAAERRRRESGREEKERERPRGEGERAAERRR